jgi:hypothetical protein
MKWLNLILIIARGIAAGYEAVQSDIKGWSDKYSVKDEGEIASSDVIPPYDPAVPPNRNLDQL